MTPHAKSRRTQVPPPPALRRLELVVLAAFVTSGMAGLVHEVAWTRVLRHVMGNTTWSITTVLTVFMGGLALGGFAGGRFAMRRRDPLLVFAVLEVVIACYCVALPFLVDALEPLYRGLYQGTTSSLAFALVRFGFSALVLLLPACCMGATLPVLSRFAVRQDGTVGGTAGRLYAANTFGAVLGAAVAGFVLLPALGLRGTILAGAVLNVAAAATAVLVARRSAAPPVVEVEGAAPALDAPSRRVLVPLHAGYALAGLAALIYEVAWTRALSLLIGSSVYAFSMILTAFVLGLALGSVAGARFADRSARPFAVLAGLQLLVALAALAVVPVIAGLPFHVTGMFSRVGDSFWRLQLVQFGLVLAVVLVPTVLMGACFPFANRVAARGAAAASRSIGAVYAVNTVGCILGAFLGGFVLVPAVGIRSTILVAALVNGVVAGLFLLAAPGRRRLAALAAPAAVAGVALLMPRWDAATMTFGPFMQARRLPRHVAESPALLKRILSEGKLVFHEEGLHTTVSVSELPTGERILSVNGKPDASSMKDLPTQELLAHVPMLLHPDPRRVLVIGLASGITLASAGRHPAEVLDCAEISPAVVRACRWFDEQNGAILDDPRVQVLTADGRNHLAMTDTRYDVIISEPSNPWIAGIADLFTREFFELCHDRLDDGGIACIWFETYNIDLPSLRSVVRTFQSVFPDAALWHSTEFDYQLVGSKGPLAVDLDHLERRLQEPAVAADLARIGIRSVEELLRHQLTGPEGARELAGDAPLHRDDDATLEFRTPRILLRNAGELELLETLEGLRRPEFGWLHAADQDRLGAMRSRLAATVERQGRESRAAIHVLRARRWNDEGRPEEAIAALGRAAALDPNNEDVRAFCQDGLQNAAALAAAGQAAEAAGILRTLLAFDATSLPALDALAWLLATAADPRVRDGAEAVRRAEKACELTSHGDPELLDTLAAAYAAAGRFDDARVTAAKALALARRAGAGELTRDLERRLAGYERGEPVGEPR